MPNWRCPRCNAENRAEAKFCEQCGQKRPSEETPPADVRINSRSILNDVKKEIAGSTGSWGGSRPEVKLNIPDIDARLSSLGIKMPEIDFKIPDFGLSPKSSAEVRPDHKPAFEQVTTRDLKLTLEAFPRLNYALAHCGLPIIPELAIYNNSNEPAQDVLIKAWLAADYGEPWQKTLPSIPAKGSYIEKNIVLPLKKSRLQEMRESERANVRVDIYTEGAVQLSETVPVEVLAYNEWYFHPDMAGLMACFVQPNSEAIEKVISCVRDRLRLEYRDTSLDGYQSGDPKKILQMLEALFYTLQKDLKLTYINPPPSFEQPEMLGDGKYTMSQKIFFPELIYEHRRGTCLDLALFCAACVERMGLNPVCFLVPGHAFYGVWLSQNTLAEPVLKDPAIVAKLVEAGEWLPLNSTTFAANPTSRFNDCRNEGKYCLEKMGFTCAVDIASARHSGFKPIPPLV